MQLDPAEETRSNEQEVVHIEERKTMIRHEDYMTIAHMKIINQVKQTKHTRRSGETHGLPLVSFSFPLSPS